MQPLHNIYVQECKPPLSLIEIPAAWSVYLKQILVKNQYWELQATKTDFLDHKNKRKTKQKDAQHCNPRKT